MRVFLLQDRLKGLGGKTKIDFKRVHVIGAGVMGGDIAAWSTLRGMTVTLQDRSEELVKPALARAKALFEKRLRDGQAVAEACARLSMDLGGSGVPDADVVIEAIYENLDAKRALYAELEPRLKPGALFATNTSSITLEKLCANLADPGAARRHPFLQSRPADATGRSRHGLGDARRCRRRRDRLHAPARQAAAALQERSRIRRQSHSHCPTSTRRSSPTKTAYPPR